MLLYNIFIQNIIFVQKLTTPPKGLSEIVVLVGSSYITFFQTGHSRITKIQTLEAKNTDFFYRNTEHFD